MTDSATAPDRSTIDYAAYLRSGRWQRLRKRALRRDHFQCACRQPATEVHHRTYERLGDEDLDDLRSVCRACHAKVHQLVAAGWDLLVASDEVLYDRGPRARLAPPASRAKRRRPSRAARQPASAEDLEVERIVSDALRRMESRGGPRART